MTVVIPDNMPEPQGKEIELQMFIDLDHANDKVQRHSQMGFCIFINLACIIWFMKRWAMIKSAVFGSEFLAVKQGMEMA